MLKSTERLAKTGERIQQGRAQLLETEVRKLPSRVHCIAGVAA